MVGQTAKRVTFEGFTWDLLLPSNVDTEIAEGRQWEPEVCCWADKYVKPGMTCLDIGANIGFHALRMSRAVGSKGKVVALEPEPGFFERLRGHIIFNGADNVITYRLAAFSIPDHGVITLNAGPYYSSAVLRVDSDVVGPHVECVALDEWWSEDRLDFIKIDTDGCELEIFQGAAVILHKFRPVIVTELTLDARLLDTAQQLWGNEYVIKDHNGHVLGVKELKELAGMGTFGTINVLCLPLGRSEK